MSIDALGPTGTALLHQLALPMGLHGENRAMISDLQHLLQTNPLAVLRDSALLELIGQAKTLGNGIHDLQKNHRLRNQNPQLYRQLTREMKQKLQTALDTLKNHLGKLLHRSSPSVTEAATSRYGGDFAADVDRIMSSNASLEDKLAMLGGLMADKLDGEIEKLMTELSNELKKPQEGSAKSSAKDIGLGILSAVLPGVGSAIAAAVSGAGSAAKSDQRDTKKVEQLQTQIQLLMDKKKNFLQMVSNLMAAESRTQNAIISNIRA